jgi:hypothetical protein
MAPTKRFLGEARNQKDSLAVSRGRPHVPFFMPSMTIRHLFLPALALTVALSGGCSLIKKSAKPTESPALAGETEASLKQRWTEKRVTELVAQGATADAARAQAAEEFRAKYSYTGVAQK